VALLFVEFTRDPIPIEPVPLAVVDGPTEIALVFEALADPPIAIALVSVADAEGPTAIELSPVAPLDAPIPTLEIPNDVESAPEEEDGSSAPLFLLPNL
jgi:hypothetical protein